MPGINDDMTVVGCTTCNRAMYVKDVDKEGNCPDCKPQTKTEAMAAAKAAEEDSDAG